MHFFYSPGIMGSVSNAIGDKLKGTATRATSFAVLSLNIQVLGDIKTCLGCSRLRRSKGLLCGRPSQCILNNILLLISRIDTAIGALQALRTVLSNAGCCQHVFQIIVGECGSGKAQRLAVRAKGINKTISLR
jgi:hypothetical protein